MSFLDHADIADVVNATVHTIKSAAHQIGNAESGISAGQRARIEEAISELQAALRSRRGSRSARSG